MSLLKHTLKWGLIWGQSRTMPGRGLNQVLWIVLCNFINLSLTRKEGIYFFTMGKERSRQKTLTLSKFKVTSAPKLPLLLRIERTDPPTWVSYFPGGSYSFASYSHPTALLSASICSFLSFFLTPRLVALNPSTTALEKRGFGTHTFPMLPLPLKQKTNIFNSPRLEKSDHCTSA